MFVEATEEELLSMEKSIFGNVRLINALQFQRGQNRLQVMQDHLMSYVLEMLDGGIGS